MNMLQFKYPITLSGSVSLHCQCGLHHQLPLWVHPFTALSSYLFDTTLPRQETSECGLHILIPMHAQFRHQGPIRLAGVVRVTARHMWTCKQYWGAKLCNTTGRLWISLIEKHGDYSVKQLHFDVT